MSDKVKTPKFRVSFPELFEAKAFDEKDTPKYSVTMLFEKGEDLSELKRIVKQAATERFGEKIPKGLRSPFNDQGEKDYAGYEEGAIYVRASSQQKPGVVDANLKKIVDPSDIYAGCYALATVKAYAYGGLDTKFKPGVSIGLGNVQKLADGEPLGGRSTPEDDFEAIEGAADDLDEMFAE